MRDHSAHPGPLALGTAAELTAFGRGQSCEATSAKNAKSPEALVLAGGILLRAHAVTGGKTRTVTLKAPRANFTNASP